jgi:asparagine synthase (glutamine-hydrolysing)
MCGIAGIMEFNKEVDASELRLMGARLSLRGPDAEGFFTEGGIGLCHRRLSIIDLDTGDQPMYSDDGRQVLVYNGEIYNFQEIRDELIRKGCIFRTRSDTEVLLQGYKHYGIEGILQKAEGMFAFALYDKHSQTLYLARDKFGEKPLYYHTGVDRLLFGSELKSIISGVAEKKIDIKALNFFLTLSYIPAPYTIYQDVQKLEPGHYLKVSIDGSIAKSRYYDLLSRLSGKPILNDFGDASAALERLLHQSVLSRMVSDVPLGTFLSGGIDSSIISAIMARHSSEPVRCFTIGFTEKEYDESDRARMVAEHIGAEHTVRYLDYGDVTDDIEAIIDYFDEPFGDSSALPGFYVAKLAAEHVKVVLTGDCADELFGGYEKYLALYYTQKFQKLPAVLRSVIRKTVQMIPHNRWTNALLRRVKKVVQNESEDYFDMHYRYMSLAFRDEERKNLMVAGHYSDVKEDIRKIYFSPPQGGALEKGFYTDLNVVLEGDMLVKMDRMCMRNSLEARVPFLDSKIVETAFRMPTEFKIKGRNKKYILKKTFGKLLPEKTLGLRKKGFGVPVDYWFKGPLYEDLINTLSEENLGRHQLLNVQYINELIRQHKSGKANHKEKLWCLYVFQKWHNKHIA